MLHIKLNKTCTIADVLDWYVVECVKDNEMRSIEDISEEVFNIVKNII